MALLWIIIDLWISGKEWNDMEEHNGIEIKEGQYFINPYNFISLYEGVKRKNYSQNNEEESLFGSIDCRLELKTELIIPGDAYPSPKIEGHNIYEQLTMDVDGKEIPFIPGSDLRGMIRHTFEALSNSCLSTVNDDLFFDGRAEEYYEPALYSVEEKKLYKAKKIKIKLKENLIYLDKDRVLNVNNGKTDKYRIGDCVFYDPRMLLDANKKGSHSKGPIEQAINSPKALSKEEVSGFDQGYIFIGEVFSDKKDQNGHVKIFRLNSNKEVIVADNIDTIETSIRRELEKYRDERSNTHLKAGKHSGYNSLDLKTAKMIPVYYKLMNNKVYVSLASRGRIIYNRTIRDLMTVTSKKEETYMPCEDKEALCPACHLFGTVNRDLSVSSKIRVSDALAQPAQNYYCNQVTLKPLSSPKHANSEFYLDYVGAQKTYDVFYTPDFYKDEHYRGHLIDGSKIRIRGRKEYWHFKPSLTSVTPTKLNATFTPLRKGLVFDFKVYFDGISESELDQLITTLNLEDNPDYCFKLGHAKPLGFGSVKVNINNVKVREFDSQKAQYKLKDYSIKHKTFPEAFGQPKGYYNEVRALYDLNYLSQLPKDVQIVYPIGGKNGEESFEWFINNKYYNSRSKNEINMVRHTLPFATDALDLPFMDDTNIQDTLILPVYIGKKDKY